MSKMNELSMLLDEMISSGEKLAEAARALKDFFSSEEPKTKAPKAAPEPESEPEPVPKRTFTKEEIRAILAAKAGEEGGAFKGEVRALVQKYGNGGSLTDVDPKDYEALALEAEAIGNA